MPRRPWRLTEAPPPHGVALAAEPGIRRIVAPNPGPMTYHGTNTWLVDGPDGTQVIDPGCDDPAHLEAILTEAGGRIARILLTHTHRDHIGGAAPLSRMSGAPIAAHIDAAAPGFTPDIALVDQDRSLGLAVIHTPGHAMDHLCFATESGILFSGDHVMGWSTSVVPPPPSGDLALFIANLEKIRDRGDRMLLSGHGPAITRPRDLVQSLLDHRMAREASIASLLDIEPVPFETLLSRAYLNLREALLPAARANLMAHLLKLEANGRAASGPEGWRRCA